MEKYTARLPVKSERYSLNDNNIPSFTDLPLGADDPFLSAWGLYGKDDGLGTLNRLTDENVVAAAREEIKTGVRISLDWPLGAQGSKCFFDRPAFEHKIVSGAPRAKNDDTWTLNTQSSSQWDGLRHYGYVKERVFYNGVTMEDIHGSDEQPGNQTLLGIQAMAQHGIVGRGVLLDFHSWRLDQVPPIPYSPFGSDAITVEILKAVAKAQGTEIKFGDILFVRSGFTLAHDSKTDHELFTIKDVLPHYFSGVEQSEGMLQWIWENFSAVAGDQPTFERWPKQQPWALHEVLLSGWGCPIGELFDLERLAEQCKVANRWSFFVTSKVCEVTGGVASPPNILAIF